MRILHVITGLNTGGAETALCRLLECLQPPEFDHQVVALGHEGTLSTRVQEANARLIHLNMKPMLPTPWSFVLLYRLIRREEVDVLHAWMYHANLAATFVTEDPSTPMLWSIRQSLYNLRSEKQLTRWVIRAGALLSGRPRKILYNSKTSAHQHESIGYRADRTAIIPNGFNTQDFRPDRLRRDLVRAELEIANEAFAIGLVARLHPVKDHDTFLKAAALYARRNSRAVFVLVGDGLTPSNTKLTKKIGELGLGNRVRLCGMRRDLAAINAALDVASSSSYAEAFPNAIGEAMSCGTPCVATDVGDVRQIVGPGGFVVPPRDPESLAAAWAELERMGESHRRSLGVKARERIMKHYTLASVAEEYAQMYRQLTRH